jgi:polyhydroxyalkanoate synthase subunit PhaC
MESIDTRPDSIAAATARIADAMLPSSIAALVGGISPASLVQAYVDWLQHLALTPAKQRQLWDKAQRKFNRFLLLCMQTARSEAGCCIEPLPNDRRFRAAQWQTPPFSLYWQAFLLTQQWWWNATTGVRGVTRHHEQVMTFVARQVLDVFSPSNYVATNPEVLEATLRSGGMNLLQGAQNWWEDTARMLGNRRPVGTENFVVGKDVAVTPGNVMFRNRLTELIRYDPSTTTAHPEPLLIVPSWIMKYYILDLSSHNSLVKYLVERGHTVYMISWRNPSSDDHDLGMDDYLKLGVLAAIDFVSKQQPKAAMHTVGYCLGGTLLSIAAAHLARKNDRRIKTISLFASELEFTEPGELSLFIDESQIAHLEDIMAERGYLDGRQMAGAFALLNSKDLVWSKLVHDYLVGERRPMTDLMAWNSDGTRMPARMHSEYLRDFYLNNALAEGDYRVDGVPVALSNIRVPIFAVATEHDHVSPWRSVYKVHLLTDTEVTFALSTGGHNAGICNPPKDSKHSYRIKTSKAHGDYMDPATWYERAELKNGSWWPEWQQWLEKQSSKKTKRSAKAEGELLGRAPGTYVFET